MTYIVNRSVHVLGRDVMSLAMINVERHHVEEEKETRRTTTLDVVNLRSVHLLTSQIGYDGSVGTWTTTPRALIIWSYS